MFAKKITELSNTNFLLRLACVSSRSKQIGCFSEENRFKKLNINNRRTCLSRNTRGMLTFVDQRNVEAIIDGIFLGRQLILSANATFATERRCDSDRSLAAYNSSLPFENFNMYLNRQSFRGLEKVVDLRK